ncbi:MAG: DUF4388 domain-containing protein [bacterium]
MTPKPGLAKRISGDIEAIALFDTAQFLMIAQKTGTLRIDSNGRRATLKFIDGQIVNAVDERMQEGETAAQRVLTWRNGSFEFAAEAVIVDGPSRITTATDGLLLEAARKMDEAAEALGASAEESALGSAAGSSHEAAFVEKQRFARELADLFGALDSEMQGEVDFRKEIPIETLLGGVVRRGATSLFLRDGEVPKARGPRGIFPLGHGPVTRRAIDRIAAAFLGGSEKLVLLEMRDRVVREALLEGVGYVRLETIQEEDLRRLLITILETEPPPMGAFGLEPARIAPFVSAASGLVLVASGPRGGKSSLCAALSAAACNDRGRHVVVYEESRRFRLREERGIIEHCDLAHGATSTDTIMDQIWRRKANVIVIDAVRRRAQFEAALEAAAGGALVIAAIEAHGAPDGIARFLGQSGDAERAERAARLADALLGVIAVRPSIPPPSRKSQSKTAAPAATPLEPPSWQSTILTRSPELSDALRGGDMHALAAALNKIAGPK